MLGRPRSMHWNNAYCSPHTVDRGIGDSRALHHMTSQQGYFITYYPDSTAVTLANNTIVKATGRGEVVLLLPSGDITLKDIIHIPLVGFSSLLPLRLIHQSGSQIIFKPTGSGPLNGDFEGADHVMHILNIPHILATVTLIRHSFVVHSKGNMDVHAALIAALVPIRCSPIPYAQETPLIPCSNCIFSLGILY